MLLERSHTVLGGGPRNVVGDLHADIPARADRHPAVLVQVEGDRGVSGMEEQGPRGWRIWRHRQRKPHGVGDLWWVMDRRERQRGYTGLVVSVSLEREPQAYAS